MSLKVAVTDFETSMVTSQVVFVPLQAPDQPKKVTPMSGLAVRVTTVPRVYASEQSPPQLIPAGLLVTVPGPMCVTLKICVSKVAVTDFEASMVT